MKYINNSTLTNILSCNIRRRSSTHPINLRLSALLGISVLIILTNLQTAHAAINLDSNISLTPSIRFDDVDWRSDGATGISSSPNKAYVLDWKNVSIFQLNLGSAIIFNDFLYAKSTVGFGVIASGDNQLSELDANNNNTVIANSVNDADDGDVFDISISFGALFRIVDHSVKNTLLLIPQIGYSVHKQTLHMQNGVQTIPSTGAVSGLDSNYESQWDGPWIGLDLRFEATTTSALQFRYEYHIADYFADANINLDNTLAHPRSLSHNADATGTIFALGWREEFNDSWFLGFEVMTQRWTTDRGTNLVFPSNGAAYKTQLGKVSWSSTSVNVTISRFFLSHR